MYISERDAAKEKAIRRMPIYNFYFMLATEHRKRKKEAKQENTFGHKARSF